MTPPTVTPKRALKRLRIESSPAIFSLPYYVALEEGCFEDEGLDVELLRYVSCWGPGSEQIELVPDNRRIDPFGAFAASESARSSLYRACEWGQTWRVKDSGRDGRVISRRAAVASQAIVVRPYSPYNIPEDLANVPIGVNVHHRSHFLAIQTLEGFLPREEIKVVGVKNGNRLVALRDGLVDAVAVMEPWITVAEKLGFKTIAEAHYAGSEMAGPDLDADTFDAINRAVTRAVRLINGDIGPYLHYFIEEVPAEIAQLEPGDFRRNRLRFVEPAPYPEKAFERAYRWMVSWDLIAPDAGYEQIVDNRLVATAN